LRLKPSGSLCRAHVGRLALACGADVSGIDSHDGNGVARDRHELQRIALAALMDSHHRRDVAGNQLLLGQIARQDDLVMFGDSAHFSYLEFFLGRSALANDGTQRSPTKHTMIGHRNCCGTVRACTLHHDVAAALTHLDEAVSGQYDADLATAQSGQLRHLQSRSA